ncbi:hypothetical protein FOQG_08866 [Fusarium oxysporum f. sp. raphani 54005]|uniref:Uncharacterized protein n=2 Tax=Fusarium oxysporum TaxID=5507 RepID=X0CYG4_FUSOX|nr:hypothetical protein FOVG_13794 [Fusarium oxysporum f. sp. pisi HDV247]EXK87517.1 hypothetical protein FOQG_08866 [Fusarium oxysporum f. sp. raphani 54005]
MHETLALGHFNKKVVSNEVQRLHQACIYELLIPARRWSSGEPVHGNGNLSDDLCGETQP